MNNLNRLHKCCGEVIYLFSEFHRNIDMLLNGQSQSREQKKKNRWKKIIVIIVQEHGMKTQKEETHTNLDTTGNGLLISIAVNPSSLAIAHSVLLNSALMEKYKLYKPSSEMVNFGWSIALFWDILNVDITTFKIKLTNETFSFSNLMSFTNKLCK